MEQTHYLLPTTEEQKKDPILEKVMQAEFLVKSEGILLKTALERVNLNAGTYYTRRRTLRAKEGLHPREYIKRRPAKRAPLAPTPAKKTPKPSKAILNDSPTTHAPTTDAPTTHRIDYHLHEQPKKETGIVILIGDGEEIRKTMELAMLYKKEIG